MTACEPTVAPKVHPTLAARFSPVAFEPNHEVTAEQVNTLLDAARLAPSAGNSQPWMFIVAKRGDSIHRRLVPHLARSSSMWAPSASLLVINLAHLWVEGTTDWEYSEFAHYDLGQAVAHMGVQGLTLGLDSHQFRAFDREAITKEFQVPSHLEVTTITAFGVAAHAAGKMMTPGTSRDRKSREAIIYGYTK